jgi:hypothetical protein
MSIANKITTIHAQKPKLTQDQKRQILKKVAWGMVGVPLFAGATWLLLTDLAVGLFALGLVSALTGAFILSNTWWGDED